MFSANDPGAESSLADVYRHARRQAQRKLLAQLAALPPVKDYESALAVLRAFRQYLAAESMADGGDWDQPLTRKLNAALAIALTAVSEAIEARDVEAALDQVR